MKQVWAATERGTTDTRQPRVLFSLRDILRVNVGCIHLRRVLILERRTPEIVGGNLYIRNLTSKFKIPTMSLSKTTDRIVSMDKHYATKARRSRLPRGGERLLPIQYEMGWGVSGSLCVLCKNKNFLSLLVIANKFLCCLAQ